MTQSTAATQDLLEQTRRILGGSTQPTATATATSSCCSTAKQEVCCETSEKSACCGAAPAAGGGCGCQ